MHIFKGMRHCRAGAKGTHAADIKVAFKTTHTQLLVTNYSRSHDRRKEKGKEIKAKDPPGGGECGTRGSDVREENLFPSLLCTLPEFNILFKLFFPFWSGRKADKSTIFTSAQGK